MMVIAMAMAMVMMLMSPQEEDGYTGLHHAAKQGNLQLVHLLLETGQVDINAQVRGGPEETVSVATRCDYILQYQGSPLAVWIN